MLGSLFSPFTARCFEITVNPDSTDPWPTETFLVEDSLEFRDELHGEPRDSLRIDIELGADPNVVSIIRGDRVLWTWKR